MKHIFSSSVQRLSWIKAYSFFLIVFLIWTHSSYATKQEDHSIDSTEYVDEYYLKEILEISKKQSKRSSHEKSKQLSQKNFNLDHQSYLKVLTPALTHRKTTKIQLENGLKVYLISDPLASHSAMAFTVGVGSWDDPSDQLGMAHLTQQLLSYNLQEHNQKNACIDFFSRSSVAEDHTSFLFATDHAFFPHLLDRFAHQLAYPKITLATIKKSRALIQHRQIFNGLYSADQSHFILRATANTHHPYHRSSPTRGPILDTITPKDIIYWHRHHYQANHSYLILSSPLRLEELKTLATALFSSLPCGENKRPFYWNEPLSTSEQRGHLIAIDPKKAERPSLKILWELPKSQDPHIAGLISFLLTSQHRGGLYDRLKSQGWIEDIQAQFNRVSDLNAFFGVEFLLTHQGACQFETIIDTFYQAVNQIKHHQISRFIFDERQTMAKLNYAYQERQYPLDELEALSKLFPLESLETFPHTSFIPTQFSLKQNEMFLNQLTADRAIYLLTAPREFTQIYPDLRDLQSGIEYTVCKIERSRIDGWRTTRATRRFALPQTNPFIPCHLSLACSLNASPQCDLEPTCIEDSARGQIYVWQDHHYRTPKIHWTFRIKTPLLDGSAKQLALGKLFCHAFKRQAAETLSYANAVGLSASFTLDTPFSFKLSLTGYSDKAALFLDSLLDILALPSLSEEAFKQERALLSQTLNMTEIFPETPGKNGLEEAKNLAANSLLAFYASIEDQKEALHDLNEDDLSLFAEKVFQQTYTEAMLTGNLTQDQARKAWNQFKEKIYLFPYPKTLHDNIRYLALPAHKGPFKMTATTEHENHTLFLTVQHDVSSANRAGALLLNVIFHEDLIKKLGHHQQAAYFNQMSSTQKGQILSTTFSLQSNTLEVDDLLARLDLFLESYVKDFDTIVPKMRFEKIKSQVLASYQQPPLNLAKMANQLDQFAFGSQTCFSKRSQLVNTLQTLTYDQLKKLTAGFFSRQNKKRLVIAVKGSLPLENLSAYRKIIAHDLKVLGTYQAF